MNDRRFPGLAEFIDFNDVITYRYVDGSTGNAVITFGLTASADNAFLLRLDSNSSTGGNWN